MFSLILDETADNKTKVGFIIKWLKEHSKDKMAGVHATTEDRRLKLTNEKLSRR